MRPVPQPAYSLLDPEKYKTVRRKFAQELESVTYHYRIALANLDELNCSQRVLFNDYRNLSDYGIEKFWQSISDYIRRVDRDEYNAIKLFRTPKKTQGTQMYTQERTVAMPSNLTQKQPTSVGQTQRNQQHHQIWYPPQQQPFNNQGGDFNNQPPQNYPPNVQHQQVAQAPHQYPLNDRYHVNHK